MIHAHTAFPLHIIIKEVRTGGNDMKEIVDSFLSEEVVEDMTKQKDGIYDSNRCNACVIAEVGLAQAFVPSQPYKVSMNPEQSLVCGTTFPALSMPYQQGSYIRQNARGEQSWKEM